MSAAVDVPATSSPGAARRAALGQLAVIGLLGVAVGTYGALNAILVTAAVCAPLLVLVQRLMARHLPEAERQRLTRWMLASFVLHFVIGFVITNTVALRGYLGPDASFYDELAAALTRRWQGEGVVVELPYGKEGFIYLLAGLYRVFGRYRDAGVVVNAAFAAALIPVVSDTTRRMFGDDAARRVVPLLVLLPGFLVWPSQLLREAAVLLLIATAVNCALRLIDAWHPFTLLTMASSLALLLTFRGYIALVVSGTLIVALTLGRRTAGTAVGTGLSTLALLFGLVFGLGLGVKGYQVSSSADLEGADRVRRGSSQRVSSGFDQDVQIATRQQLVSYLPVALPKFMFGPLPGQVRGARQMPALFDALVGIVLFPSLVRGVRRGWRRAGRRCLALLLPAVAVAAVLSVVIGNYGTIVRERPQVTVLLLPLIALGLAERPRRRRAAGLLPPSD